MVNTTLYYPKVSEIYDGIRTYSTAVYLSLQLAVKIQCYKTLTSNICI